ncbi:MAG: hypothetical protein ABI305_07365, partial [Tepidiformaceae bacterium]
MIDLQQPDTDLVGLGPMAGLLGVWEGHSGTDTSPGMPDRAMIDVENNYSEKWVLELVSPPAENHDQKLRQVTFATSATRGTPSTAGKVAGEAFHAQAGYLVWDAANKQLLASFAVP